MKMTSVHRKTCPLHVDVASSMLLLLIVMISSVIAVQTTTTARCHLPPDVCCEQRTERCGRLFEMALEHMGIEGLLLQPKTGAGPDGDELVMGQCIAYRTYLHCLKGFSCIGNINYHVTIKGLEQQMSHNNCTPNGYLFHPPASSSSPDSSDFSPPRVNGGIRTGHSSHHASDPCFPAASPLHEQRVCALFGDPHLRTFSGTYHTCAVHGTWPLVDNEYFTVQVTSETVGSSLNSHASVVTKVTVLLKRHDECGSARYVTYEASSGQLPATFDDGRARFRAVELIEREPNAHVEIRVHYIDTTIVIRQMHGQYAVFVRSPVRVANATSSVDAYAPDDVVSFQLCSASCPRSELIRLNEFFADYSSNAAASLTVTSSTPERVTTTSSTSSSMSKSPRSGSSRFASRSSSSVDDKLSVNINKIAASGIQNMAQAVTKCRDAGVVDYFFDSCVFDLLTIGDSRRALAMSLLAQRDLVSLLPNTAFTNRTSLMEPSWRRPHSVYPTGETGRNSASGRSSHSRMQLTLVVIVLALAWNLNCFTCR